MGATVDCMFPHFQSTPNEFNFALNIEKGLNRIIYPEYRQLIVEALMVLSLVLENEGERFINGITVVDQIVGDANRLFLEHQVCVFDDSASF